MSIYYQDDWVTLYHGDCLDVMAAMPADSVDAIVTDPPYGLSNTSPDQVSETITRWVSGDREYLPTGRGFMGKEWDAFVPPVAVWDECLRVLKPGGHLVAFAGPRTHDLMTLSVRLAGFEMRDSLAWLYGSGFPKSMNVGKAIDKRRDEDLEPQARVAKWLVDRMAEKGMTRKNVSDHFNAANVAQQWTTYWTDGAVKPRVPKWDQWQELKRLLEFSDEMDAEVWRLNGRKGMPGEAWEKREITQVATRELVQGDAISFDQRSSSERERRDIPATPEAAQWEGWGTALKPAFEPIVLARKPLAEGTVARNVLTHGTGAINIDACRIATTETLGRAKAGWGSKAVGADDYGRFNSLGVTKEGGRWPANVLLDEHTAAWVDEQSGVRKSGSRKPGVYRGIGYMGSEATEYPEVEASEGGASRFFYVAKAPRSERPEVDGIKHPTVKPLALMRWLLRLVTPPGGTVLDPFAGSGTTIEAAMTEDFHPIGIEKETDYLPLITARIARAKTPAQDALDLGGIA